MEKIIVLDNYDSFTYNLVHYIESNPNYEVDIYRNDEVSIEHINNYNTIILSPGPGLPKDAGILKQVIQRYASTKKILGVCLGMQAIGEVFGANLQNLNKVLHGVATKITITQANDLLYKGIPEKINVGRYHSWIISNSNLPNNLIVTATDENNQIMSIKHQDYNVYGVQYHPESILTPLGKKIINNFLTI
jgi:anthranilate synthase component II